MAVTSLSLELKTELCNLNLKPELIDSTIDLIQSQWFRNREKRVKSIKRDLAQYNKKQNGFPVHLIITLNNHVIGHSKLTKSYKLMHGRSGILYDVVINPIFRGQNLGKRMMIKLEEVAYNKGISHLYLSTHTAAIFYSKLGFAQRKATTISDLKRNADRLSSKQVKQIESILVGHMKRYYNDNKDMLVLANSCNRKSVWMAKRLSRLITFDVQKQKWVNISANIPSLSQYTGYCYLMPFIEQIGPCCGFAAMANIEYFVNKMRSCKSIKEMHQKNANFVTVSYDDCDCDDDDCKNEDMDDLQLQTEHLIPICRKMLENSIEKKLTFDGEMFDLELLTDILKNAFDDRKTWTFDLMDCNMENCWDFVYECNQQNRESGESHSLSFLIIPYDKKKDGYPFGKDRSLLKKTNNKEELKHSEMDDIDIDMDFGNISLGDNDNDDDDKKENAKIKTNPVALHAHFCFVCGGYLMQNKNENNMVDSISTLIDMIDTGNGGTMNDELKYDRNELGLIYMSSSRDGLYCVDAMDLLQSNSILKNQRIPSWSYNKNMNLAGKMIRIQANL